MRATAIAVIIGMISLVGSNIPVPSAISVEKKVICPVDDCSCYQDGTSKTDENGHFYWGYVCSCNRSHKYWVREN